MSVSVSVERLRVWLLVGAGLLVLVIGAFLGYAHWLTHRFLTKLPEKLGIDVRQETNAYTYSQTVQGRTIYTIHAAKAVQHNNGKYTLHDVGIVLYGQKQDRADRIYGDQFEYDPAAQIIRAMGVVFIDLQAPEQQDANAKMDYASGKDAQHRSDAAHAVAATAGATSGKDERLIHVKTSGLVYQQKLGLAETGDEIEFTSGGLVGHATGAAYNSNTGLLILHSAVKVNGLQQGRPVVLTASHAELDRQNQVATLLDAKYVAIGDTPGRGEGETVQAPHMVIHLRKDGTAERLDGDGGVILTNGEGGTVTAPTGEMILSEQNRPVSTTVAGGVVYGEKNVLRQGQGQSSTGWAAFDKSGQIEHLVLTGNVHLHERVKASEELGAPWSERDLVAGTVEMKLAADHAGKAQLEDAKAKGAARLNVVSSSGKPGAGAPMSSDLAGDSLTAHFLEVNGADHLSEVHGEGHTLLRRVAANGIVNTSSGDLLVAKFRPATAAVGGQKKAANGTDGISTAVQQGHVLMTQTPLQKAGDPAVPQQESATAEQASYDGDLDQMTLTGKVEVSNGAGTLWADRVITEQSTDNATANGSVKATYRQAQSTQEPLHVLSDRADFNHDSQVAIFYGVPGRPARLWQAASQVEAPVLQLEQQAGRLLAHGRGQGDPMAVHTVLVSVAPPEIDGRDKSVSAGGKNAPAKTEKTDVVQVQSRELVYSDQAHRADFSGGIQVESADGTMIGQQAVVYLKSAPAAPSAPGNPGKTAPIDTRANSIQGNNGSMSEHVDRIVATGHIEIREPGRKATGEQVVYTASDQMFVLTGTSAVLPRLIDQQQGTITGTSLRFHAGDENVLVSNGGDSAAGQRVRTETRVKSKQ